MKNKNDALIVIRDSKETKKCNKILFYKWEPNFVHKRVNKVTHYFFHLINFSYLNLIKFKIKCLKSFFIHDFIKNVKISKNL